VPGTDTFVNKPVSPEVLLDMPEISLVDAVASNCSLLSGVPEVIGAGALQVMVGVKGHPGGVQEYAF
jgi:hypothetical protein